MQIAFLLALMAATLSAPAQKAASLQAGKYNGISKVIVALESKWAGAQKTGRADIVAPLLAESFVNTDAGGVVSGKKILLSNLKGGKWEHNEISGVEVKVYGSTAIATGGWAGKGVDGDGTKIDRRERWTDTWVEIDGIWLCVASQQTTLQ